MSVSSRSPTISGRSPPTRRTVSSSSGRCGLPATSGSTPLNELSVSTSTPCPGATPYSVGNVRSVLLATHGRPSRMRTAACMMSRHTHVRTVAADDRLGLVVHRHRLQAFGEQRLLQPGAAQQRDLRAVAEPVGQQPGRGLGRGHHVALLGGDAQLAQVLGDPSRAAGRRCW